MAAFDNDGNAYPAEVPFSLVCYECDAGMDVRSHEQAVAEGWTRIDFDPGLPMANFVGVCPDCREPAER